MTNLARTGPFQTFSAAAMARMVEALTDRELYALDAVLGDSRGAEYLRRACEWVRTHRPDLVREEP